MPAEKTARSRSSDPMQEHLRERKQVWNKACSEFIARLNAFKPNLISFKRGLNGRGDPKAGIPVSNIKDPLPTEVGAFLSGTSSEFGELASTFSALVTEANSIIQEQAQYSMKRRKSQPRQSVPAMPVAADVLHDDDMLIVEGSNALTRFWANISSLFQRGDFKNQRLSMLDMANTLFENFVDLEDLILEKNNNFEDVLAKYYLVSNNVTGLRLSFNELVNIAQYKPTAPAPASAPQNAPITPPAEQQVTQPPSEMKPSDNAQAPAVETQNSESDDDDEENDEDIDINHLNNYLIAMVNMKIGSFDMGNIRPFIALYHGKYVKETNENKKEIIADRLKDIYNEIFAEFKHESEQEFGVKLPRNVSLSYIFDLKKKQAFTLINDPELVKYANNYFSRLYKQLTHYLGRKKGPSASRIKVYEQIRQAKKHVDKIMDLLEKRDLNFEALAKEMSKVEELIVNMGHSLRLLNVLYMDKFFEGGNKTRKSPMIDPVGRHLTKQLRRDVDKPGW